MEKRMSEEEYQAALEEEKKAKQLAREMDQKLGNQGDPRPPLPPELEEKLGGDPEEARERIREMIERNLETLEDLSALKSKERSKIQAYMEELTNLFEEKEAQALRKQIKMALEEKTTGPNYQAPSLQQITLALDNITGSIFDPNYKDPDPGYTGKGFPVRKWQIVPIRHKTKKDPGEYIFVYDYGEKSPVPMGPFHELICNICGSLLLENDRWPIAVSVDMIGRKCMGKSKEKSPNPIPRALADDITKAMDDLTRYVEKSKYKPGSKEYYANMDKQHLLNADIVPPDPKNPIRINGALITRSCFILYDFPWTWKFAREDPDHLMISSRDLSFLDIPGMQATKENLVLCQVLLKRMVKICHDHEASARKGKALKLNQRSIVLETLLKAIDYVPKENPAAEKEQRKELIKKIKKILDYWVSKGLIGGYNFLRDTTVPGNPYRSIEITFPKKRIKAQGGKPAEPEK